MRALKKRQCPECGASFRPKKDWQVYDKPSCANKVRVRRYQAKLKSAKEQNN